jgi:cytochrome c biogenesis factor
LQSSSLALLSPWVVVYGVHPALVEAVAFISCRDDLLVTTFLLLALLAHARWMGRKFLRPLGVGLAFLAAALTKEMAIVLPPALVLWSIALARQVRVNPMSIGAGVAHAGLAMMFVGIVTTSSFDRTESAAALAAVAGCAKYTIVPPEVDLARYETVGS